MTSSGPLYEAGVKTANDRIVIRDVPVTGRIAAISKPEVFVVMFVTVHGRDTDSEAGMTQPTGAQANALAVDPGSLTPFRPQASSGEWAYIPVTVTAFVPGREGGEGG